MKKKLPELLAPAGNQQALFAAVSAGADAVYLGLEEFNARRNADNFTIETLREACDYAHLRGVKVYVTLNTVILPHELQSALDVAREAYLAGADAFIVQDIGLCAQLSHVLPEARIHASTQMNIHSAAGIEAAVQLGASRITCARELSLEEVAHLSAVASELGAEIEVFAHGALCVCYSGQCLMSSLIGGRSANRGMCAQACRLPYVLKDVDNPTRELRSPGPHVLSPKDLCTIDLLPELIDANVASLKIEGRMKSPEYVHSTVSAYRAVLDRAGEAGEQSEPEGEGAPACVRARPTDEERAQLSAVFSRGFTQAYLSGERNAEIMSFQRPNNRGQAIGRVKSLRDGVLTCSVSEQLVPGDVLEVWTSKGNKTVKVEKPCMTASKTASLEVDEDARGIRPNDRVFRVRSADASFTGDAAHPKIPIIGWARLRQNEPLEVSFRLPTMAEFEEHVAFGRVSFLGQSGQCPAEASRAILRRLSRSFAGDLPSVVTTGQDVEAARTKALEAPEVIEHINRLGQTPFALLNLTIDLEEGVGLGFSQLHRIRASALAALEEGILAPFKGRTAGSASVQMRATRPEALPPRVCVLATNPECARAAKRAGADALFVPALNYKRGQAEMCGRLMRDADSAGYPKNVTLMVPSIDHDAVGDAREAKIDFDAWQYAEQGEPLFVESIGSLFACAELGALPQVGPKLPLANGAALAVANAFGAERVWLSPELTLAQIRQLAKESPLPLGIFVQGYLELMVCEHCLLTSQGPCNEECATCPRRKAAFALNDRLDYDFRVVSDVFGRSHLYNSVQLDIVPAIKDLIDAHVSAFMIDATFMDPEQTAQATGRLLSAIKAIDRGEEACPKLPHTTSGHLYRGVS